MSMKLYNRLQIGLSIAGVVFILLGCVIGGLTNSLDSTKSELTSSPNMSASTSRASDLSDESTDDSINTVKASEGKSQRPSE